MKNFYLLIIVGLLSTLVSCSKDEEGVSLSPPSWIIGNWADSANDATISYTFTSDDVIDNVNNGESLKVTYASEGITEDTKTTSVYQFTVNTAGIVYRFEQQSSTTLSYISSGFGGQVTNLLTRQN